MKHIEYFTGIFVLRFLHLWCFPQKLPTHGGHFWKKHSVALT